MVGILFHAGVTHLPLPARKENTHIGTRLQNPKYLLFLNNSILSVNWGGAYDMTVFGIYHFFRAVKR